MKRFFTIFILIVSLLAIILPVSAQGAVWGDRCADGTFPKLVQAIPENALDMAFFISVHGPAAQEAWEVEACAAHGGRLRELNSAFVANQSGQMLMDDINFFVLNRLH